MKKGSAMTYAWTQDLPITLDIYREIVADLGHEPAEGLIVHVAQVLPDGRMRYLDVWDSEAACDRFTETRLHPVVGSALARHKVRIDRRAAPPACAGRARVVCSRRATRDRLTKTRTRRRSDRLTRAGPRQ
jgi:hypothetical protein